MRAFARLLSVLLHPVWMPTLLLLVLLHADPYLRAVFGGDVRVWILCGVMLVMTGLFPVMSTYMMKRAGIVGSMQLPLREERIPVLLITLLYHSMAYWLLRRDLGHPLLLSLLSGGLIALALSLVITFRWKISLHLVGIGGLLGGALGLVFRLHVHMPSVIASLMLACGALGSARLLVGDHRPAQVHVGALLGGLVVFLCTAIGLRL